MRKVLALSALVLVVACGGGGEANTKPWRFIGSWAGTWSSSSLGHSGTMTLDIDGSGNVLGTSTNTTTGQTGGVVDVQLDTYGAFNGTEKYPGQGPIIFNGTLVTQDSNNLSAQFNRQINGVDHAGTGSFVRQ